MTERDEKPAPWQSVLDAWFLDEATGRHDLPQNRWFAGGAAFDTLLRERFADELETAACGGFDAWLADPHGALAIVVLLDQFSRNIHRGSARAFSYDAQAGAIARLSLARGHDAALGITERVFLYLPFEHEESRDAQMRALELCESLQQDAPPELADFANGTLDYAREHAAIIERFGRYPHRNEVLGRESTAEEGAWLDAGAKRFGQ